MKVNKRTTVYTATTLLTILAVIVGFVIAFGRYSVVLTEADVQQKIEAQLPKQVMKGASVTETKIKFTNPNAEANITMTGVKLGKPFTLKVFAKGVPEYDQLNGHFYFKPENISVTEFSYEGSPQIKLALKKAADRYVTNKGLRNAFDDIAPHLDTWIKEAAETGAIQVLNRTPVYKLKDNIKGLLIRASLESISVGDGTVTATVSAWVFTKWVAICIICVALGLGVLFVLMKNPELLTIAALTSI